MTSDIVVDLSFFDTLFGSALFITAAIIFGWLFLFYVGIKILRFFVLQRGKTMDAFKKKILMITVPRDIDPNKATDIPTLQQVQEKIGIAETFFSTIAGLKAETGFKAWLFGFRDVFSFEMVLDKEGKINFYLAVPAHWQEYVEQQLQAQFPQAFIEEVADYNIFGPKSVVGAKALLFGKDYIFPIKTYKKFDSDPLNSLTNALSKIEKGDGAALQIVFKSAPKSWHGLGMRVASEMQQGKKLEKALKAGKGNIFLSISKFFDNKKSDGNQSSYRLTQMEEEVVKGLEEKTSKAGVDANIRLVVASEDKTKLDRYLANLVSGFSQYNVYQYGNGFKPASPRLSKFLRNFIYRNYEPERRLVLNTEELASLFHLPIPLINESPSIRWLESKKAAAPFNAPAQGTLLGKNVYRGRETMIRIKPEDRRRHMYIIGMTGTGKSYFMSGLAMQDIAEGKGVCYIDPHGDDLDEIMAHIPPERAEDVILFDPSDIQRPVGLNLLEFHTQEEKTFAINELMAIFDKLYDLKATGGPMFEQYFKNSAGLIMADPDSGSTLMEISRVLADEDFRKYKLAHCQDQLIKDFWEKEALKAGGEASLQNMVPYITSKMSPFISNDYVRPIISQQKSTINFADAMNEGKIILVKLSKGKIGKTNADLLGMVIIGKILMAALGRADMPADQRKDFFLYIDEFQNFLTDSIEIILSEARKYRLCLNVAHQYIGQLIKNNDTKFKDAIFGNVGTKVAFRIGVDDAEVLAKEFSPTFSAYDFLNVPAYNCFVKLMIDNANPAPFNMKTLNKAEAPIASEDKDLAEAVRSLSRLKYGKDPKMIELEIKERQSKQFVA